MNGSISHGNDPWRSWGQDIFYTSQQSLAIFFRWIKKKVRAVRTRENTALRTPKSDGCADPGRIRGVQIEFSRRSGILSLEGIGPIAVD